MNPNQIKGLSKLQIAIIMEKDNGSPIILNLLLYLQNIVVIVLQPFSDAELFRRLK